MLTTTHVNPALTEFGDKFTQLEPDSITVEEGDLLYALVRMRKPRLAIETGTGQGAATRRIGEALRDNHEGFLFSCDTDPDYVRRGYTAPEWGLPVILRCMTGLKIFETVARQITDFIFVDAGDVNNRMEELRLIVKREVLAPAGLLVIHDAINKDYKRLVEYMKSQGWPGLVLESLAGIAVFQKP